MATTSHGAVLQSSARRHHAAHLLFVLAIMHYINWSTAEENAPHERQAAAEYGSLLVSAAVDAEGVVRGRHADANLSVFAEAFPAEQESLPKLAEAILARGAVSVGWPSPLTAKEAGQEAGTEGATATSNSQVVPQVDASTSAPSQLIRRAHYHSHAQHGEGHREGHVPNPSVPEVRRMFPAITSSAHIYSQLGDKKHFLKACTHATVTSEREASGWCEQFRFESAGGDSYAVYTEERHNPGAPKTYLSLCGDGTISTKQSASSPCEHFYFEALRDGTFTMFTKESQQENRTYLGICDDGKVVSSSIVDRWCYRFHIDTLDTTGYVGCFINEVGDRRIDGHIPNKTHAMCHAAAVDHGKALFGLENPAASPVPGQANCLLLDHMPHWTRAPDSECAVEDMMDGSHLGGPHRLALYRVQEWVRIFHCDGVSSTGRLDFSPRVVRKMAQVATSIKICTKGDGGDCVISRPNTQPMRNLRSNWPLNHLGTQGSGGCGAHCIAESWREVGGSRLSALTSTCTAMGDHPGSLDGSAMLYETCGDLEGLHLSVADAGKCGWSGSGSDSIEVFIDAQYMPVWMDLSDKLTNMSSIDTSVAGAASNAVDGDPNPSFSGGSCTQTLLEASPWWSVDLGVSTEVVAVKVTNRGDCCGDRLNPFLISVDGQYCAEEGINLGQTKEVHCEATGHELKITTNKRDVLNLCEVQVLAFVPVWLKLKGLETKMSSEDFFGFKEKAIDGNSNPDFEQGGCTHTKFEASPWWEVDLGHSAHVVAVKVTNRADCCGHRLSPFSVSVDDRECATSPIRQGQTLEVSCLATGRTLKISTHRPTILTLCEVAVKAMDAPVMAVGSIRQGTTSCLGVGHHAELILRPCPTGQQEIPEQEWMMPLAGIAGHLSEVADPANCLDMTGAISADHGQLQMWHCDDGSHHSHMKWVTPVGGEGPIRWAAQPDYCIDAMDGVPELRPCLAEASGKPIHSQVWKLPAEASICRPGTWFLSIEVHGHCDLRDPSGLSLCSLGSSGNTMASVTVQGDSCQVYHLSTVQTCGPKDRKCFHRDCGSANVIRLENAQGIFAEADTEDGMLTCGDSILKIARAEFGGAEALDIQDDQVGYMGCFRHAGDSSTIQRFANDVEATSCRAAAWQREVRYFGLENPQGTTAPGRSNCFFLAGLPDLMKAPDVECEIGGLDTGYHLGGAGYLAVYHTKAINPLSDNNLGCETLETEELCVAAKDGRKGQTYSGSPCQWCCGKACTLHSDKKCMPQQWLFRQLDYVGRSKNGLGDDSCQAAAESDYEVHAHGNGCGTAAVVNAEVCLAAAKSLGFNGSHVETGAWHSTPPGCFVGHPADGWNFTYFNLGTGSVGSTLYRSICVKAHLSEDNEGCGTLISEELCVGSRDGKANGVHKGSPCRWCCGEACTSLNSEKCAPESWLLRQHSYNGRSRNFLGDDTCESDLAPAGAFSCRHGTVPQVDCLQAARKLIPFGKEQGHKTLQVVNGTGEPQTGLGGVPQGCSLESGGDWTAFYNVGHGINNGLYSPVCEEACEKVISNPPESHRNYSSQLTATASSMLDSSTAWVAAVDAVGQWVEIEMPEIRMVSGVVTQGASASEFAVRVSRFTVQYQEEVGGEWKFVPGDFASGFGNQLVEADFPAPVAAKVIRVVAQAWERHVAMRVGLVLCSSSAATPDGNVGLEGDWLSLVGHQAYQSSTARNAAASRAVDGSTDTDFAADSCTMTGSDENNPWWELDLGGKYEIRSVKVTSRGDCCSGDLDPFYILVDDEHCATGSLGLGETGQFPCHATGSHLKIELRRRAALTLCEVQLEGTRLAPDSEEGTWLSLRGHTASQSNTGRGGNAEKAIDGTHDGDFHKGSCTYTVGPDFSPWWEVDLGKNFQVKAVKVTNRDDCCGSRLFPFHVKVDGVLCATATKEDAGDGPLIVDCEATGSKLRIEKVKPGILTLCEVEVQGFQHVGEEYAGGVLVRHCVCDGCGAEEDGRLSLDTSIPYDNTAACVDKCKNNPACKRALLYRGGCALFSRGARLLGESADPEHTYSCWVSHEECIRSFTDTCGQGDRRCTNRPDPWMVEHGLTCETWDWMYTNRCNAPGSVNPFRDSWVKNRYCQQSCWENRNAYDHDDCSQDTTGFVRCLVSDLTESHENVSHATLEKCRQRAADEEKPFFGLSDPESNEVAGQALCLVLDSVPAMTAAPESECNAEGLIHGYRLGSHKRLAIYSMQAAGKGLPLDNMNDGCRTLTTEESCTAARDGTRGHSYSGSPCQWCCGQACTSPGGNLCEPSHWLFRQHSYVGTSKNGIGEDNCQVCGSSTSSHNFSSMEKMKNAGWQFDWQDHFTFRPSGEWGQVAQLPKSSYYGFKQPGSGSLRLHLQGAGILVLDFGNAADHGIVTAGINNVGLSAAPAATASKIQKFVFHDGDVLHVHEEGGIIVINNILFDCMKSTDAFLNMSTQHGPGSCADSEGRAYDSWYGTGFTMPTCEAECRALRDCLGFDFTPSTGGPATAGAVGHCELRFSDGLAPHHNPGAFQARWADGTANGPISGVLASTIHDVPRHCYRKKPVPGQGYATCTDHPDEEMRAKNLTCDMWDWMYSHRCNSPATLNPFRDGWVASRICQRSCWEHGNGYDGDDCSKAFRTTSPIPDPSAARAPTFADAGVGFCVDEGGKSPARLSSTKVSTSQCEGACAERMDCLAYSYQLHTESCDLWVSQYIASSTIHGMEFTGHAGSGSGTLAKGGGQPDWRCFLKTGSAAATMSDESWGVVKFPFSET